MKAVLSNRENVLEDFAAIFGDEEIMKNLYPETYEAYIHTRNDMEKGNL